MAPPLLITASAPLRDDLLRLAAAAGVTPDVAGDLSGALRRWPTASLVLVGVDLASALADLGPARRDGVHLVAGGAVDGEVFRVALGLGAEGVVELASSEAWIVERLTDAGDPGVDLRPGRRARRRLGWRRRHDAGLRARAGGRPVAGPPSSSTATRWARGSTGSWGSTGATAPAGRRCARPPGGSAAVRCARRSRSAPTCAPSRGGSARPRPRSRSRSARRSRPLGGVTTRSWSTSLVSSTPWSRTCCHAATRWSWWSCRPSPGSPPRAVSRRAWAGRPARHRGARCWDRDRRHQPRHPAARSSPRCRTSAGSPSPSTWAWGRSARGAAPSARTCVDLVADLAELAGRRLGGMSAPARARRAHQTAASGPGRRGPRAAGPLARRPHAAPRGRGAAGCRSSGG